MHQIAQFFQKIYFPGGVGIPLPPNKLLAFFVVVAKNTNTFKLFLPQILIKIHFKMHQTAALFQNFPGEHYPVPKPLSPNKLVAFL